MAIKAGDAVIELGLDTSKLDRGLKGVSGRLDAASKKWGRKMKIAGGIIMGVTAGIAGASLKMASDFETAMRRVNSMMALSEEEFAALSAEVRELARAMGVDAVEAAGALYQAISLGVPRGNVIEFLEIATKAAIGGTIDTTLAVDGLMTIVNAFQLPLSETEHVADVLFKTVEKGGTNFGLLSEHMSKAMPIAAALGVSYEDVLAAVATLTKQGIKTPEAFTAIRGSFVALMKPTAEMGKLIQIAGYETGEAMFASLGYAGTLQALSAAAEGNNEVLAAAFGQVEAMNAVYGLTGENVAMATEDIEAMTNATGAMQTAFEQMEKSPAAKMRKLKAGLKDVAVSIGAALMPALIRILEIITPLIAKFGAWAEKHPKLITLILAGAAALGGLLLVGGILLPMIASMITMLPMLGAAFTLMLGPVGLVILAIAAIGVAVVAVIKNWDDIKEAAKRIWEGIKAFFQKIGAFLTNLFLNMTPVGLIIKHWDAIGNAAQRVWGGIVGFFEGIPGKIKAAFSMLADIMLAPFRLAIRGIEAAINWIIRQVNKIGVSIPGWVPGIGGKKLGFNIQEISLPKFDQGGMIREPTLLYGMKSMRPYATAEKGETVSPGGGLTVNLNVENMQVRDEEDLKLLGEQVSQKIYQVQRMRGRQLGVA